MHGHPGYGSVGLAPVVGGPDDIVGGYASIIGQALQSVIGQMTPQQQMALASQMAQAREVDPNAVAVLPRTRDRRRRLIMGNQVTSVTSGSSADIEYRPQQLVRTERIIIPSAYAADIRINDVRVGNQSQLLATGALPGQAWSEVATDAYVHFDSADIGNIITLSITNTGSGTISFLSMLLGTAAL